MFFRCPSTLIAQKVKKRLPRTQISIRIVGNNSIRIGHLRADVETTYTDGADGLQIDPQDKIVTLWWAGDMWAIAANASPATFVIIENTNPKAD